MTEQIPQPPAEKRVVPWYEELRRKREGKWDPTTMVGETTPEGAALRALQLQRALAEKVAHAKPNPTEPLKNQTLPKVENPAGDHSPAHKPKSPSTRDEIIIDGLRLISQQRVAAKFGVCVRTLKRWRDAKKGPPWLKIGRTIFYDEDKLKAWIKDR